MPTRQLAEDEQLLVSIKPKGLKNIDPAAIQSLYQQKPNRMVLGSAPYLWFYYLGKNFYSPEKIDARIKRLGEKKQQRMQAAGTDTTKVRKIQTRIDARIERVRKKKEEGNFVMQLGEPPAIYDSTLMVETMDQIKIYLNSKGYFNHTADYVKTEKGKKVYIDLNLNENAPYRYSSINYNAPDTAMLNILQARSVRSLVNVGDIYDEEMLSQERDRVYELMKNRGYYDFARAYIEFEVDTSFGGNSVRLRTIIQKPEKDSLHRAYTINNVYFKTDADRFGIPRDTVVYKGVNYLSYDLDYSKRVLDKKVDIYPGERYSQLRTATTQRKLSDLDVFQFSNVVYTRATDPADSNSYKLNAFINAVPNKKYQETTELGLNYTERRPGPFASINLRIRNVFHGAENLDIGLRGGLEGQVNLTDELKTVMIRELGADVALSFPRFLLPFNSDALSDFNPRTRIYTGYTNVDRQEYKRTNYDVSLDYIWQKARRPMQPPILQYILSPVNLQIAQVDTISPGFKESLERYSLGSRSLLESFESSFLSFMSFNLIYNTNDFTQTRNARYFRTLAEIGGLTKELGLSVRLGDLRTFQFAKINPDYRRYLPLGNKQFFVYRINMGVASPILQSEVLPYDKYFFAGGGSSVRAWQPRRLGPGSFGLFKDSTSAGGDVEQVRDFEPEQPGEVLLEANVEYRYNIFGFLNGAFFVDAGNVWFLKEVANKPGADFKFNRFYKELAVGTGFGLRLDLSVVILRFDFATKVYDPAGLPGNKFILGDFRFSDFFTRSNQSALNIGIGYPF